jgi:hypothetical protein
MLNPKIKMQAMQEQAPMKVIPLYKRVRDVSRVISGAGSAIILTDPLDKNLRIH